MRRGDSPPPLSVVLPVLNEAPGLTAALEALVLFQARGAEVIVVDGGSSDGSADIAARYADRVIDTPRGRARQMNAGAAVASGRVLLFLHADTRLPEAADRLIAQALASGRHWGRFDVHIKGDSALLPVVARMMNWRSRLTGIATGDQAIFVSTEVFQRAGGFPEVPLMEDIGLSKRLLGLGRPACLAPQVTTSGRRWETNGVMRTILLMWGLRLRYFFGADPHRLAMEYGYAPRLDMPERVGVAILARAPVPGQVKTRLIPALGASGAARLQRWLLRRTVSTALEADIGPVVLWCAGDPGHPDIVLCRALGPITVRAQPEGDLGTRMLAAVQQSPTPAGTLVIGTDCPALGVAHLREAAQSLRTHDALVLPAEDGGYVLIGIKAPSHELFAGVDWGTERVMAETRQRLRALGWRWSEPATLWDVDRPADVERLANLYPEVRDAISGQREVA